METNEEACKPEKSSLDSIVSFPNIEPTVIDNAMLIRSVMANGPKKHNGLCEEDVQLDTVALVRLEFYNILRIDHLWMLTSLTRLILAHNLIENIENLERLINLKELDLSFNKIEIIENIDTLVNLEVFTLYHNKIRKLENMCNLERLLVFSIGDNYIEDYNEVAYLRRFRKLRSVSVKGNPCCDDPKFYQLVASVLDQIKYLDYKIITEEEREAGRAEFRDLLHTLDEDDEIAERHKIAAEEYNKQIILNTNSFVENLSSSELIDAMFENDPEGNKLLTFGGELIQYYDLYKQQFVDVMTTFVKIAQDAYIDRENEIKLFKEHVDKAVKENVERSKIAVYEYEVRKKYLMAQITELTQKYTSKQKTFDDIESGIVEMAEQFNDALYGVWLKLMTYEMNLFEQLEESRIQFSVNMTEKIVKLQAESRSAFGEWRNQEGLWSMNQSAILSNFLGNKIVLDDDTAPVLIEAMMDEEQLMNMVAESSDNHIRFIDAREDVLTKRSNDWCNKLVQTITDNEIKRNRGRILEINNYIDHQRFEWMDLQMTLNEPHHISLLGDDFFDI